MGQCSTQPADGANQNETAFREISSIIAVNEGKWKSNSLANFASSNSLARNPSERRETPSNWSRQHNDEQQREGNTDFVMTESTTHGGSDKTLTQKVAKEEHLSRNTAMPKNAKNIFNVHESQIPESYPSTRIQTPMRKPMNPQIASDTNMKVDPPSIIPNGAIRTRCYRLNLDFKGTPSPTNDYNGPYEYNAASHLYSIDSTRQTFRRNGKISNEILHDFSSDASERTETQIAVKTAMIFRDLVVTDDGNIISKNPRVNRGSTKKVKVGEKSRQAAKIDKAKDLIDDVDNSMKKETDEEENSKMISLVIVGEYDDIKCLVREGARRLKENEAYPDDVILKTNLSRRSEALHAAVSRESAASSSRFVDTNKVRSSSTYRESKNTISPLRSGTKSLQSTPQSCPPKLKGHPRDLSRSRRSGSELARDGSSSTLPNKQSCNEFIEKLLNCGETGETGRNKGVSRETVRDSRNSENSRRGRLHDHDRVRDVFL